MEAEATTPTTPPVRNGRRISPKNYPVGFSQFWSHENTRKSGRN
jgi:hypothetical protein